MDTDVLERREGLGGIQIEQPNNSKELEYKAYHDGGDKSTTSNIKQSKDYG